MPRLTLATIATETPMGAQVYQEEIASRAGAALAGADPAWTVRRLVVRSMRAAIPGNRRMPLARVAAAPESVRRHLGRLFYAGDAVAHRMNLELPPAPGIDVVTLHDVVAWRFPDESAPVPAAAAELRRAAAVICVSQFSAEEAVSLLGIDEPYVVHNGVDRRFFDPAPMPQSQLDRLGVVRPFVLVTGGASHRKNLDGLAEAWRQVERARPDLSLVLAGPHHPRRSDLFKHITSARLVGRLPDEVLPGLYAAATAVVVPSRYEGFGLPALEGMAAGAPVVAADTSSLPEVVGDGGLLVQPSPNGLAEGILYAVSGADEVDAMARRGRARAADFTWERSTAGHAKVWQAVAG